MSALGKLAILNDESYDYLIKTINFGINDLLFSFSEAMFTLGCVGGQKRDLAKTLLANYIRQLSKMLLVNELEKWENDRHSNERERVSCIEVLGMLGELGENETDALVEVLHGNDKNILLSKAKAAEVLLKSSTCLDANDRTALERWIPRRPLQTCPEWDSFFDELFSDKLKGDRFDGLRTLRLTVDQKPLEVWVENFCNLETTCVLR